MQIRQQSEDKDQASWLKKLTALLALLDLVLVLFHLNYVSWQGFYLKYPSIRAVYEPLNQHFWQIDSFFCLFFSVEFLVRTLYLSRHHSQINWLDAMLWRWYDVFLLLPFWRVLRIIPVVLRLHQAGVLKLNRVHTHIKHGLIANLGGEIAEVAAIRVINQAQSAIESGEVAGWLLKHQGYTNINSKAEAALSHRLLQLTVTKVLPKVQPDVEALLHQNIESALGQSPFYKTLQQLPATSWLPKALSEHLAHDLTTSLYNSLETAVAAPLGEAVINQMSYHLRQALRSELEGKEMRQDIELLLSDLLEDVKLSYLRHSQTEAPHQTLAEIQQLRQQIKLP